MQPVATTVGTDCRLAFALADRTIGDVHPLHTPLDVLRARQVEVAGERWAMLDEVHGTASVDVDETLDGLGLSEREEMPATLGRGDILVTRRPGRRLGVWVADCAPVALLGDGGTLVAFHAGWLGLASGIIDIAARLLQRTGERPREAVLGPTIGPCCYEFGTDDLERVAVGADVPLDVIRATTSAGTLALDVPATVRSACELWGVVPVEVGGCTGCGAGRWYSHRVRRDLARHALVVWSEMGERA